MKSLRQQRRSKLARKLKAAHTERFGEWLLNVALAASKREGKGPMAWCNTCHRVHRRGDVCDMYLRERTAKSNRKVKRWAH